MQTSFVTRGDRMTSAEARRARETLGLTRDQLAIETNNAPFAVAAWEDGRIRVPKHIAVDLKWRVAAHERQAAIEAGGLPTCDWIRDLEARAAPADIQEQARRIERLMIHAEACQVCAAREAYIAERCPPMPPAPEHGWFAVAAPIARRIRALPPWAREPVTLVAAGVAYAMVKLLLVLPDLSGRGAAGVVEEIEGPAAGVLLATVLITSLETWRRRRDARLSPERQAALERIERQMAELAAYGVYEGAALDACLRERRAIRSGELVIADL